MHRLFTTWPLQGKFLMLPSVFCVQQFHIDMFLFLTFTSLFVNDITTYRSNTDIIINTGKPYSYFVMLMTTSSADPHLSVFVSLS